MSAIATICHFHAERFALPGFIEAAEKMFDEIVLVSSPMDGTPADPETIAIAEASGHRLIHDTLSQGFGALRTRCISYPKSDWVFIMDADERVWPDLPVLDCEGTEKFPHTLTPQLRVSSTMQRSNQRESLRRLVDEAEKQGALAICVPRRHWFGAPGEWDRPCQNWKEGQGDPDWQLRLVKNSPWLCYDPEVRIHEKLVDVRTFAEPKFLRVTDGSLFLDHHSWWAKQQEPEQNAEDAQIYETLQPGSVKDMWLNHYPKA